MSNLKGKMKFLAVKLESLRSELRVSKEIVQEAGSEVDKMFKEKYFPEIPVDPEKTDPGPMEEISRANKSESDRQTQDRSSSEDPEPTEEFSDDISPTNRNIDPEVRKLFRKIATITHPDKLEQVEEGFEKDNKRKLHHKAMMALEDNDIIILSYIASELGIDTPTISPERLKIAEKQISDIKKELKQIESTYVWHWFFCSDSEKKNQILTKLFEIMYANNSGT
jgi:hypothetical protein